MVPNYNNLRSVAFTKSTHRVQEKVKEPDSSVLGLENEKRSKRHEIDIVDNMKDIICYHTIN